MTESQQKEEESRSILTQLNAVSKGSDLELSLCFLKRLFHISKYNKLRPFLVFKVVKEQQAKLSDFARSRGDQSREFKVGYFGWQNHAKSILSFVFIYIHMYCINLTSIGQNRNTRGPS